MDFNSIARRILSREASVQRIGSIPVAPEANPYGVVEAMEMRNQAECLSTQGQDFFRKGQPNRAITCLCQSIVLEDAIGNMWGLISDLGNIAEIYRHCQEYEKAENIFVWLRVKDQQLIDRANSFVPQSENKAPEYEANDYHLLYGQHTEGLARVYIATNRRKLARPLMPEVLTSYRIAQRSDRILTATDLDDWLIRHPE
jgi:hypothetical protein